MGGACGIYRGKEKCIEGFSGGNLKERDQMEDLGVDGRNLKEIEWEGVDWTHLSYNRNNSQAVVNTVMNLWVP
jgi:hypothetical protein